MLFYSKETPDRIEQLTLSLSVSLPPELASRIVDVTERNLLVYNELRKELLAKKEAAKHGQDGAVEKEIGDGVPPSWNW